MAGSERSGPFAATESLFDGRPWAVTPHEGADPAAVELVTALARACGATPVRLSPGRARPGGRPHLAPAAPARRDRRRPAHRGPAPSTSRCPGRASATSPGSRPATRGCGSRSSPRNTDALTGLLRDVRDDVDTLLGALTDGDRGRLTGILDRGVAGTAAIPGKHGGPARRRDHAVRGGPRPPGRAGPAAGRRGGDRRQRRGPAHRPRPGPRLRPGRAHRRPRPGRPPAVLARGPGLDARTGRLPRSETRM